MIASQGIHPTHTSKQTTITYTPWNIKKSTKTRSSPLNQPSTAIKPYQLNKPANSHIVSAFHGWTLGKTTRVRTSNFFKWLSFVSNANLWDKSIWCIPNDQVSMPAADLSSLKWEDDGEMSAQDTWNLVRQLTKVEDEQRASALLHLSSKHRHSKCKPNE